MYIRPHMSYPLLRNGVTPLSVTLLLFTSVDIASIAAFFTLNFATPLELAVTFMSFRLNMGVIASSTAHELAAIT